MNIWTPEERLNYIYAFMKYQNEDLYLDFWQDAFIRSKSKFTVLLKSRQTGFSFVVALKGLVKALDPARTNYTKQFVSYNLEDAKEKIRYALQFYDSIPSKYKKPLVHANSTMLEFQDVNSNTTSRLISFPCREPRGKNGDVCLDEFAIYLPRMSHAIYQAALWCTLRRGCIEIGSTPLGTKGRFYDICIDKKTYPNYERYFVPWWYSKVMCKDIERAISDAKNLDTFERVEKYGTNKLKELFNNSILEDFKQECECTFIDSASSYISLELIYANTPGCREADLSDAMRLSDEEYLRADFSQLDKEVHSFKEADEAILKYNPSIHGAPLFMGYDVGRVHDASAIYILGVKDGKKRAFFRAELFNLSFPEQQEITNKLLKGLPIFRACIDCTGMGAPLYDYLKKDFGDRVEGVTFTLQSKEALAMGVKFGLERLEFELENDKAFHSQIHSIKRIPSAGGNFRYDAERNETGHADSFWAFALANNAAVLRNKGGGFYSEYSRHKSGLDVNSYNITQNKTSAFDKGHSVEAVLRKFHNAYNRGSQKITEKI